MEASAVAEQRRVLEGDRLALAQQKALHDEQVGAPASPLPPFSHALTAAILPQALCPARPPARLSQPFWKGLCGRAGRAGAWLGALWRARSPL